MPRIMTLGKIRPVLGQIGMRLAVDPRVYGAGDPSFVGSLGSGVEPSWTGNGWSSPPPSMTAGPQNLLRPTSSGCGTCSPPSTNIPAINGLAKLGKLNAVGQLAPMSPGVRSVLALVSMASCGASAFHGYKRYGGSIGWAIGWGLMGAIFPVVTPAIALAQGFGKRRKRK